MTEHPDESRVTQRFYRARSLPALAAALKGARAARGYTQDDLAAAIGSSRPTISRMERANAAGTDTLVDALSACGYELVVVPRGSTVRVTR
ncbi:helix-turn-helix domain-containing protein [Cellulomonas sp. ACRRI]|uniref:helix-turn-helix domain-containing protein n=1 Tax=Cellulomonas sp. ACRRI TaxID=2918188 RepID=UPI001EF23EB8|nr:helix-turn-helix transcriptional regulator [Cellulomonas sp. ACRRI]MCG7288238.1 helix-turn-helix domain-containing protein [Cellulomonas sp. ACRRI]